MKMKLEDISYRVKKLLSDQWMYLGSIAQYSLFIFSIFL